MVPLSMAWPRVAMDKTSPELSAYLRTEFRGADAEWMAGRIRKGQRRTRGSGVRLIRRRASRDAAPSESKAASRPSSRGDGQDGLHSSADDCDHEEIELLGRDGPTAFARCQRCGALLIGSQDTVYLLRPEAPRPVVLPTA